MEFKIKNNLTNKYDNIDITDTNLHNQLSFYVCGPTIYNDSHIGHARTFITFDMIRRILNNVTNVNYGMNITDIDDKILDRVKILHWKRLINDDNIITNNIKELELYLIGHNFTETEMTPTYEIYKDFITKQEQSFWTDMSNLNNLTPTFVVRVSDIIDDIVLYINELINKEYAYISNGSVYLDTKKYYENYNKNCLHNGEEDDDFSNKDEHNNEKKDPKDFVLWKKAKKYEISFKNIWDNVLGRPGWHIECSTIIKNMFDNKLDIHGGGIDLKFPHHNNEYMQTTAYTNDANWVKYFIHSGHINIGNVKMSQSLNNFMTIKDFLKQYSPRQMRLLVMLHKYDSPLELNDETLKEMTSLDKKIEEFITNLNIIIKNESHLMSKMINEDIKMFNDKKEFYDSYNDAIIDNFNMPLIITIFRQYMKNIYVYMSKIPSKYILETIQIEVYTFLDNFGLDYRTNNITNLTNKDDGLKDIIIEIREKLRTYSNTIAKENKQIKSDLYKITDWIRDVRLPQINLTFQDTKNGTKIINL